MVLGFKASRFGSDFFGVLEFLDSGSGALCFGCKAQGRVGLLVQGLGPWSSI